MTAPVEASAKAIAEAEAAAVALQAALTKLGFATIAEAIKLWRRMPANKAAEMSADWLNDAVFMVMTRRQRSRELAVAYYRLARALRTGTTIPDPYDPIPTTVTLGQLRREFAQLTASVDKPADPAPVPVSARPPISDTPNEPTPVQEPSQGDTEVIRIEPLDGITEDGDTEADQLEADAEREARLVLETLGPNTLKKRVGEIDHERPASEVDHLRDEAHAKAGSRQAAAADRIVKNGARHTIESLGDRDKRVIGWVRYSTTGTPCGWCAMLISRGFVPKDTRLYGSEFSAERKTARAKTVRNGSASVGDLYHDNCNCRAQEVYGVLDLRSSRFDINREYGRLWPIVTKGKSGKAALSAWRSYFRQAQKAGDQDTGEAQAA